MLFSIRPEARSDIAVSAGPIALGSITAVASLKYKVGDPGPRVFPLFIAVILVLLGIAIASMALLGTIALGKLPAWKTTIFVETPELKKQLATIGAEVHVLSPQEAKAKADKLFVQWTDIVQRLDLRAL